MMCWALMICVRLLNISGAKPDKSPSCSDHKVVLVFDRTREYGGMNLLP